MSLPNTLADHTDTAPEGSVLGSQSTITHWTTPQRAAQFLRSENRRDAVSVDFSNLDLLPLGDAEQIRLRWMRPFFAVGDQLLKTFHPYKLQYITCVLRAYPKQMTEDSGLPPIIHPMQMTEPS